MQLNFKNNFFGYFKFYYQLMGNKLVAYLLLSVLVSLLDGIGLAMFMPLLQAVGGDGSKGGKKSMGQLHFFIDVIEKMGFQLTVGVVLTTLALVFSLKGLLRFFQLNFQVKLKHSFIRKLRYVLLDDLRELSFPGFLKLDAGRIQNTFTGEVTKLFAGMNAYFNATQNFSMLFTYVMLAFLANYQFAFLVAIGAGLSNLLYRRIYIATKDISMQLSTYGNKFNRYLVQAIHNFKYLKSTNYFGKFSEKLRTVIYETELLNRKVGFYNAITTSAKEPIIIIVVVIVIQVDLKFGVASLSSIILSLLLFYRALNYLAVIQNNWQLFIQNIGGMASVTSLLNEMSAFKEEQSVIPFTTINDRISIKDVEFSYGSGNVLDVINLRIPKNETIALVGESGSGKTTLANMIAGLIKPSAGELLIDAMPLNDYNLSSFRNKIGYISQDPVIFTDSIFNNITFWAEPTPENVAHFWKTVELASLTEFISSLAKKEHAMLGNNGILISGGQKQRISIARELYKDTEILILDEATSALDSETEKIIQENIEKLHGSYTMIIIAHRLSTIKNADIIYLLDKGKVSASGKFSEMIENSERFKRMVSLQEMK